MTTTTITKHYEVTISLVVGHYNDEDSSPKLKNVYFFVNANSENEAIEKAKALETSSYSVWESYAYQIDEEDVAEKAYFKSHPELNP